VVEPGRFRTLEGNYESYVEMIRLRRAEDAAEAAAKPKQAVQAQAAKADESAGKKERRKRKFPYRKTAEIEADILEHETRIEEWQAKMSLPETVRDGRLVKECHTMIEQLKAELAKLYEHWEEAAELN
jgi:ATP-binding cassette, subfamily F, member 3